MAKSKSTGSKLADLSFSQSVSHYFDKAAPYTKAPAGLLEQRNRLALGPGSQLPEFAGPAPAGTPSAPNMPFTLVEEFCRAVASNLRANIHVELLYGRDGHHIAEAIFKGLARALRDACERDPRVIGIPSTKDAL